MQRNLAGVPYTISFVKTSLGNSTIAEMTPYYRPKSKILAKIRFAFNENVLRYNAPRLTVADVKGLCYHECAHVSSCTDYPSEHKKHRDGKTGYTISPVYMRTKNSHMLGEYKKIMSKKSLIPYRTGYHPRMEMVSSRATATKRGMSAQMRLSHGGARGTLHDRLISAGKRKDRSGDLLDRAWAGNYPAAVKDRRENQWRISEGRFEAAKNKMGRKARAKVPRKTKKKAV